MATTLRKCRFLAANDGTDDFVVGAAIPGFLLPSAAHAENLTYNYMAFFGNQFESGDGLYDVASTTLTRDLVLSSSSNDQLVDFAGIPTVIITNATELNPPGRLVKSTFITSSTTWNKDLKTKSALMFVTGAGAAGGSAGNNTNGFSGGGSGATSISLLDVTSISSYNITIGAPGTAAPAGGGNGGNGGDTIVGSNVVVAKGGIGGNGTTGLGGLGGDAASGVGQIKLDGNAGQNDPGGDGAPSFWGGGGGKFRGQFNTGSPGKNYGAGGSGSCGDSVGGSGSPSGAGSPGVVWVLEFS